MRCFSKILGCNSLALKIPGGWGEKKFSELFQTTNIWSELGKGPRGSEFLFDSSSLTPLLELLERGLGTVDAAPGVGPRLARPGPAPLCEWRARAG